MRHAFPHSLATRASRALLPLSVPALVVLATCFAGCSDGGTAAPPTPPPENDAVEITESSNYITTDSKLIVDTFEVAAEDDIEVCWNEIAVDIQGHAVDPETDINMVSFVRVKSGDEAEVAELLNTGELGDEHLDGNWEFKPDGEDCAPLSEFQSLGDQSFLDPEQYFQVDDDMTYLLIFASGSKPGFGARTMIFIEPTTGSSETEVSAPADTSGNLTFDVDLSSPDALEMPAEGPWKIDWTAIENDNHGNPLIKNAIDRVLIGFYEGKDVADLEEGFLDLDQKTAAAGGPTRSWELKVAKGTTAILDDATGRNGEGAFTGFETDKDGTWLIGAFCGECRNPAPVIVTILDPQ
jgi:hypothetical protein